QRLPLAGDRQADGKHRARSVQAIGGNDGTVHGLDESARDGEPEAGACAHLVDFLGAVELVEDVLKVAGRNAATFVDDPQGHGTCASPSLNADCRVGGSVFRGVVEQIEQHLLKQYGVEFEHGQIGREFQFDFVM